MDKNINKEKLSREYEDLIRFCRSHGFFEYENQLTNKYQDFLSPLKVMIIKKIEFR